MSPNRFDYVKYDEIAISRQETFKTRFKELEELAEQLILSGRARALVLTNLEVAYMWVGKGIRDDQLARNSATELQEGRGNE